VKRALFVVLAAGLVACEATPPPVAPPAPPPAPPPVAAPDFRAKEPPLGPAITFVPPKIEEARLANGIRVLVVEQRGLPIVAVDLAVDRGAEEAAPGVGSFAGAMLMRGTKTRSAIALSDELAAIGASADASTDFDSVQISSKCLTPHLGELLAIVADVAEHPAFAKDEIERERSRRLTALAQQKDRPRTILSNTIAELLYPAGSAYASPLLGDEAALKKIAAKDLAAFHAMRFTPDHVTIALAGDLDKATAVAAVEKAFGKWKGPHTATAVDTLTGAAHGGAPKIIIVDRPGATQSSLSVVEVGVPRRSPDFDAITIMNTILGGQFSARINMNLREAHAYTYGAFSSFDMRHHAGPFAISGEIVREHTGEAVAEIMKELARIRDEPVSEEELADAKAHLIKQLPARFETVSATAATLAALSVYGLPLDEFATRPARWAKITREDVQRAAKAHLVPIAQHVVLVGDAKVVKAQLESLKLGDVVVRPAAK
jgi:predicted Zn-dependent peptidase